MRYTQQNHTLPVWTYLLKILTAIRLLLVCYNMYLLKTLLTSKVITSEIRNAAAELGLYRG